MSAWMVDDIPDQAGRTILVTGANSGLGLRSAEALASRGARVLMGCRNQEKAAVALETVKNAAADAAPEVMPLDLADLDDVRACAKQLTDKLDQLDVLMNNAGVMAIPHQRTKQGFEMQFGTNHLGHFALTGRLLPILRRADAPRVVSVSSIVHRAARIRFNDWEEKGYSRWFPYIQSKLANLLFTSELQRRATAADADLLAVAAHPGYAARASRPACPPSTAWERKSATASSPSPTAWAPSPSSMPRPCRTSTPTTTGGPTGSWSDAAGRSGSAAVAQPVTVTRPAAYGKRA